MSIRMLLVTLIALSEPVFSEVKVEAIVNAASYERGVPAGGSLATVFLSGTTLRPGTYLAPQTGPIPYQLGGIQVNVNGALAPLLAVIVPPPEQARLVQINFQVPLERNASLRNSPAGFPGYLLIAGGGVVEPLIPLPYMQTFGGFFSDAKGYAIARHEADGSAVSLENPARPGETITAFANDLFPVWPPPPMGVPAPAQPKFQILPIGLSFVPDPGNLFLQKYPTLDSKGNSWTSTAALRVLFAGLAEGLIGVEKVTFVVPADKAPGDWDLFYNVGSCTTPPGNRCHVVGNSSPSVKLPVRVQ